MAPLPCSAASWVSPYPPLHPHSLLDIPESPQVSAQAIPPPARQCPTHPSPPTFKEASSSRKPFLASTTTASYCAAMVLTI